jgi:hypothetical protein
VPGDMEKYRTLAGARLNIEWRCRSFAQKSRMLAFMEFGKKLKRNYVILM